MSCWLFVSFFFPLQLNVVIKKSLLDLKLQLSLDSILYVADLW